jgi:predicted transcriptional regulator
MTTKEKILAVIHSLSDEVSIDEAIDRLYLLRKVETGILQADVGDVMEHDEFMKQLDDEEASEDLLDSTGS